MATKMGFPWLDNRVMDTHIELPATDRQMHIYAAEDTDGEIRIVARAIGVTNNDTAQVEIHLDRDLRLEGFERWDT